MIKKSFCAFTNKFLQLFTIEVREHQSNVTYFNLIRSHQTYTSCIHRRGRDDPQLMILLSMDGHIKSADRSLVAQLLEQKLMRNLKRKRKQMTKVPLVQNDKLISKYCL